MRTRLLAAVLGTVLTVAVAGCSGSSGGPGRPPASGVGSTPGTSSAPAGSAGASGTAPAASPFPSAPAGAAPQYYVSLGDSYAAGYQPNGNGKGMTTTNGFAYQLVTQAKAKGYDYTLANFGCAGATTTSMLTTPGCAVGQLGPGATPYAATQTAAAVAFLKAHQGHIGLVTVSIGGNDVLPCGVRADALTCLSSTLGTVRTNLASILTQVRAAAGPDVRIAGITYPDVLLGNLLSSDDNLKSLASLSVTAFQSLINPQLQQTYQAAGARFVDVTAGFGGYGPLTQTTTLPSVGTVPVPVARICTLTYYCQYQDIHPMTSGYALIASLIAGLLPPQ